MAQKCISIHTENGPIDWVKETTHLGVTLVAGPKFIISLDNCKTNFYSSFNAIYSQLGKLNSIFVTLKLISTIAVPCLMYAMEAVPFSKSFLRALEHPWTRVFNKIFASFDANTILGCQFFRVINPWSTSQKHAKLSF